MYRPGCTGKRRFDTEQAADAALTAIWSRCRPGKKLPTRKYLCDHGEHWHITSKPKPGQSRKDAA